MSSTRGNNGRYIKTPKRDRSERNKLKHKQMRITEQRVKENIDARLTGTTDQLLEKRAAQGDTVAALDLMIRRGQITRPSG
jgi:hypothetical protein